MIRWIPLALVSLVALLFIADAVNLPAWASYVQCKLVTSAACLNVADQTVTGGANVTSLSQSTGNITVDCGARPAQYIANGGAFTITAPSSDGYCYLDIENNGSAGAVSLSGFVPNTIGGATLDTTNGHNFRLIISRVHAHSNIFAIALQ